MWLTGRDVWEVFVKMGYSRGSYDLSNRECARADAVAVLLNDIVQNRGSWLPNLTEAEDAIRAWEADTPREYVLRLYKYLNQCGYTVIGIDAEIEREAKKRRAERAAELPY